MPSPQHSNMFGHLASWQTVCRLKSLTIRVTRSKVSSARILTLSQSGRGPVSNGLAIFPIVINELKRGKVRTKPTKRKGENDERDQRDQRDERTKETGELLSSF